MRRRLLALVLLAACAKRAAPAPPAPPPAAPGGGPPALAEREPNDDPDHAQLVADTARIDGDLHPVQPASRPDEDWYRVQPPSPRDLRAELESPAGARLALEVYDRDRDKLLGLPAGPDLVLPSFRVKDTVYLRVSSPAGAPGPYTLALRLSAPDPDGEVEPNDRPADATPLSADHPLHATLGTPGDLDWYRVDLAGAAAGDAAIPAGGAAIGDAGPAPDAGPARAGAPSGPSNLLRLSISAVPGLRLEVHLFDQAEQPLGDASARPGEPIAIRDLALFPGVRAVYLVVKAGRGPRRAAPDAPYTIAARVEPAPPDFEIEPNDALAAATPISAVRRGYLSPAGDVDDYLVHLPAPALLHATLSPVPHVETELSLVDAPPPGGARERLLLRVRPGPFEAAVIPAFALPAGDHFLRVQAAAHQVGARWVRDQENAADPYELAVALRPDEGRFEREPNDTPATATPIQLGQTLGGYAFPAQDVDFFRLDLSAQPVATGVAIRLSGVPRVPLALRLSGPLAGGDARSAGPLINTSDHGKAGAGEEIRAKLDPGVYLIRVRPAPVVRLPGLGGDPDDAYALSVTAP